MTLAGGEAQSNLGLMYFSGQGVPKVAAAAVNWYRKAAEQGLAQAQSNFGNAYSDGDCEPRPAVDPTNTLKSATLPRTSAAR